MVQATERARAHGAGSGGLPERLRAGVEALSGFDLSDVRVHRNSGKPAEIGAAAYARGTEIHLGPGAEQHLPHEAWHVVQQKQGRVPVTTQFGGAAGNDDAALEAEADAYGRAANRYEFAGAEGRRGSEDRGDPRAARTEPALQREAAGRGAPAARPGSVSDTLGAPGCSSAPSAASAVVQRAIPVHAIDDAQNVQAATPAARKVWLQGLAQGQVAQLLGNPKDLKKAINGLEKTNAAAHSIILYEISQTIKDEACTNAVGATLLLGLNEMLNRLEVALGQAEQAPKGFADVLVGNEFTFTNNSLTQIQAKDKDDLHQKMIKPYNALAAAWKAEMAKKGLQPSQERQGNGMLHLEYRFDDKGIPWGYQVTPDQFCVEVITHKAPAEEIYAGHVGNLMDEYIFNVAAATNLVAHATIGGGHINIDEKTAFGSYSTGKADDLADAHAAARKLIKFAEAFYADHAFWEDDDQDTANAAFPKDLGKQDAFQTLVANCAQAPKTPSALAEEVMKHIHNTCKVPDTPAREAPHYQALNFQHLGPAEQDELRRLEVRRVRAQPDRKTLIKHLNRIAACLRVASKPEGQ